MAELRMDSAEVQGSNLAAPSGLNYSKRWLAFQLKHNRLDKRGPKTAVWLLHHLPIVGTILNSAISW